MANAAVVVCKWEEDGQPAVTLTKIKEPKITNDQGGETEVLMGLADRAHGFAHGLKPSKVITFTVPVTTDPNDYDWVSAADRKAEGVFTKSVGARSTNYPAAVDSVEEDTDDKRHDTLSVTLKALYAEPV